MSNKKRKGFTLIEVLIYLAITTIIMSSLMALSYMYYDATHTINDSVEEELSALSEHPLP